VAMPTARLWRLTDTKKGYPQKLAYLARAPDVKRRRFSAAVKALGGNSRVVKLMKARGKRFRDPADLVRIYGLWGIRR